MNAHQEQEKIQELSLIPGITIFSKGRYTKVTPEQVDQIRLVGMGWLMYCQKRINQTHRQAIAPALERYNTLEKRRLQNA